MMVDQDAAPDGTDAEPALHGPAEAAADAAGVGVAAVLGSPRGWHHWLRLYRLHMPHDARRERLFLASVAFAATFILTRGLTLAIRNNVGPFHNVSVGGTHVHHLVYGILLLLLVGYFSLVEFGGTSSASGLGIRLTALAFGIGAALTLDEFALWLNLQDVYWEKKGRESIDAVLAFSSLLLVGIFGQPIFRALTWEFRAMVRGAGEAERIAHLEYERMRHGVRSAAGEHPDQPVDRPA
ncbi:MAG TPA: hypothetical protein VGR61_02485 [Candidatus Dormibacteraeota bacterium]|nr:hypothetical protein [Candidatus Dormibacteraeota bacterium]